MLKNMFRQGSVIGSLMMILALTSQAQVTENTSNAVISNYKAGVSAYQQGNFRRAFDAWSLGAYEGSAEAQYNLGVLYLEGRGIERSPEQARIWFLRAADNNQVEAQFNLGHMSLNGMATEKDVDEALSWWQKAAEGGYAAAQFNYGRALYLGVAAKADEAAGLVFIQRSAEQEDQRAIDFLAEHRAETELAVVEPEPLSKQVAMPESNPEPEPEFKQAQRVVLLEPLSQASVEKKPESQAIIKQAPTATEPKLVVVISPTPKAQAKTQTPVLALKPASNKAVNPVYLEDNQWLFTQENNAHVIHVFTVLDHQKAVDVAQKPYFKDNAHVFTTRAREQNWTFLLLGPYENEAQAKEARSALPRVYAKGARIRLVSVIAQNRCKKRASLRSEQAQGLDVFCFE
ncbi:MAG: hypothetical protein V3V09_01125 [Arenicellales bacterium]